jgi:hypothetical protein
MSIIKSKRRRPSSLGYNSWSSIQFGNENALVTPGTVYAQPLGLNYKFTHLTYGIYQPTLTPGITGVINVRSGSSNFAVPTINTSYGYFDIGGTYAAGDKLTLTLSSVPFVYTVTGRDTTKTILLGNMAAALNSNPLFNSTWICNTLGVEMVIQPLAYNTTTYVYSIAVQSAAGTATAGGAVMVAGSGLPTFTAQAGHLTGTVFATKNFDAIWPANSSVVLTSTNNGPIGAWGGLVTLYGVPVDNHIMQPQAANGIFLPGPNIL